MLPALGFGSAGFSRTLCGIFPHAFINPQRLRRLALHVARRGIESDGGMFVLAAARGERTIIA
jgi:hypothetical protein